MKLLITKQQAPITGLFGKAKGVRFELKARVELTNEESGLVTKYKADSEVLLTKEITTFFSSKPESIAIKVGDLLKGETFACQDVGTILAYEENVKAACNTFKNYLEVMKTFGGEEVIEY